MILPPETGKAGEPGESSQASVTEGARYCVPF
jgi:hypothetical protein